MVTVLACTFWARNLKFENQPPAIFLAIRQRSLDLKHRFLWFNLPCAVWKEELILRGTLNLEKYVTIIHEESVMRRYGQNILRWSKIKTKNMKFTQWRLLTDHPKYVIKTKIFSKHINNTSDRKRSLLYPLTQQRNTTEATTLMDTEARGHGKYRRNMQWTNPATSHWNVHITLLNNSWSQNPILWVGQFSTDPTIVYMTSVNVI